MRPGPVGQSELSDRLGIVRSAELSIKPVCWREFIAVVVLPCGGATGAKATGRRQPRKRAPSLELSLAGRPSMMNRAGFRLKFYWEARDEPVPAKLGRRARQATDRGARPAERQSPPSGSESFAMCMGVPTLSQVGAQPRRSPASGDVAARPFRPAPALAWH